jgi:HAD superfamily hydrolase (TIGR01484 family)
MSSKYKLAVFDIDGVLNEHGGNILPESVAAIAKLRSKGIQVCFASGKHAWYIHGGLVWSGLLDENTFIVAEMGGVIYDPHSRRTLIKDKYLKDVVLLRNIVRNLQSSDDGFNKFAGMTVWEEPKESLFCLYPEKYSDVNRLANEIREIIQTNNLSLKITQNPDSIDASQEGINKATGITYICNWLNIRFDEIIAFGDNYNDIEMLGAVGYPVTVANGISEVKNIVSSRGGYIARDKFGIGVLEAVEFLEKSDLI